MGCSYSEFPDSYQCGLGGAVFSSDDKNSYSQLEVSQWYNYQSYETVQG